MAAGIALCAICACRKSFGGSRGFWNVGAAPDFVTSSRAPNKCLAATDSFCENIPRLANMRATNQTRFIHNMDRKPSFFRRSTATLLCLLSPILTALAQNVLSSPPQTPAIPPVVQEQQNSNPMQVFTPLETLALPLPLQWGQLDVHPHVDYQFSYGNGVQSSPGQQQNTIVQQLSPGVLFNLGDHWTLDYTPTLFFYSSSSFRNTVDHNLQLGWGTAYGSWFFSGSQGFSFSSDPNIETAAQTSRQNYSTALNAAYQFNNKMSLDIGLSQNFSYVGNGTGPTNNVLQGLANSKAWSTMDWLNYQFRPRLNVGVGAGFGYTRQENGPDAMNEQYQARVNWRATDKISYQLSGGLEGQQYLTGGAGDLLTPIFSATIQYQPFEQTKISVTGSRTISPASYQNQTSEGAGITAVLNQRLLGRLNLNLSGSYGSTKYVSSIGSSSASVSAGRHDDYYSFSARLSCPLLKRGTVSVFCQHSENSSRQNGYDQFYQYNIPLSQSAYSYTSTQVGFEIGWRY